MKHSCANCTYWCKHHTSHSGECRRHAPAPMYSMTGDKPGPIWWPQTLASFWCGDFTERPADFAIEPYREVPDANYTAAWHKLLALERNEKKSQKKNPEKNGQKMNKK